jgi:hypothetical protein
MGFCGSQFGSAFLAICVLLCGCGSPPPPAPPPSPPAKPQIRVHRIPEFPSRVLVGKEILAKYGPYELAEFNRKTEDTIRLNELPDTSSVQAQVLHPDGWKDGSAKIFKGSNEPTILVFFDEKLPEHWKIEIGLQVDNRGGEATEIFVGAMPEKIKAGGKDELFYPAPSAAEHAVVRIGGKEVGTLWPVGEPEPDRDKADFLIDVSGKRDYRYREVYYSSQGISAEAAEFIKLKPVQGELRAKFVHRVPFNFSFFLEPAPSKIELPAKPFDEFVVRTEIVDR